MRKGDRSKTKASRAARAQELLISSSQNVAKPAAFGFGGFSGSQQIAPASQVTASAYQSSSLLSHGDLDAEVAQRLRQLSKKDASTKIKALQALKVLLGERPAEEIEGILLAWTKPFQRLVMDNDRLVRTETATFMAVLAPMAGRTLAKALKNLAGPWWLAQADPDPDCSSTFKAAFFVVFPAAKQREALTFCRSQILDCLERNVRSKPADLAELHKEDIDELEERHERVVAASLRAMGTLLDVLLPADVSNAPDEAAQEAVGKAISIFLDQDMVKRLMGLKGSVLIRSCSYSLLSIICKRAPSNVEQHKKQLAPHIFGGLNDKESSTHTCMWDMVLSFVKAVPTAWNHVDVQKAVIPRLLALLRNACYGSAEVSSPAILPFLAQMPRGALGPDPGVMCQILGAMWQGWQMAGNIGGARAALALCYTECLVWAMSRSQQLAGEKYETYCDKLLGSASIIANALNTTTASNSAADTILKLTQDLSAQGMPPWILRLFLSQVERALSTQFAQQPVPSHYFDRGLMMLQRIAAVLEKTDSASLQQRQAWLAELVYKPLREGVLEVFGDQDMPAAAAHLLAYLLHPSNDGPKGGADLTPGAALAMFVSGPAEGPSAVALADLLLATVQRCETPAKQLGIIATNLVCAPTSRSGSTDCMASLASSGESSGTSSPVQDFGPGRANGRKGQKSLCGNLLHLLTLVKQLTETLEKSGATAKDWRSPRLDAVAHLLLQKRLADDDGAWQVLGALIIGDGSSALLSDSALSSALDVLASHIPQAREDMRDTEMEADLAALNALDAVLFSRTVLVDVNQDVLRPAAVRALVAFFQVAWNFGEPDTGSMTDDEEVLAVAAVSRVVCLADIAKKGWNSGLRLAQVSKGLAPDMRASLRRALLQSVVGSIDRETPLERNLLLSQDLDLVQRAVSAAQSIITAACIDADDKDDVLDTLLRPRHGWPQYVRLEGNGIEKGKGAVKSTSGRPETLSELAYALGTGLGFNSILYDADGRNRVWLVAELLCFSEERAGAGAAELQSFLAEKERLLDLPGVTVPLSGLLDGTLDRLLNGALGFGTGVCDRDVYAHALGSLLRQVVSGSDRAAAAAHGFLRSSIAGPRLAQLPADFLSNILDSVASTLRGLDGREPAVDASGLAGLAEQLLKDASGLPPLMAAVTNHSSRVDSCLTSVDLVVRCFPVGTLAPPGENAASINERAALIALWQRQLAGHRAVKAAVAAEKRSIEPIGSTDASRQSDGKGSDEAAATLAKLSTCVVAYCWRQLDAGQWADLLVHAKEGVAAAAVIMEEQAEAVVKAGRKAATVIAGAKEVVPSDIALAVLRRLSLLKSAEAAQKLESAVEGMVTELACEQSFEQLCKLGEGWLRVLALALDITTRLVADCDLPRDWHQKLTEVLSEALRLLFAAGICTAFIVAAGQRATDLAAMYFEESAMIWTAVSRAAEAALSERDCLAESIKAIDTWAADTGVDAFTAIFAMMHASYSHAALQSACLRLLTSPTLLQRVATVKDDEDEEEVEEEATAVRQEYSALVEAGMHAQVAAVICGVIGDGSSFCVTWGLVLARLLSMAGPARRRVAQAFGDFDELITRLMEVLVPLLPMEETPSRRSRGPNAPSPSPPQLSAAQRAAQAAQARADGSAWSLTKELAMLGVPDDEEGDRRLAVALYRGVLSALPASAKSWFGRLNNRSLETAIEAYTASRESPDIISAELGGVSGVATSDVADTAEFRMRASLASREAVAILCIEESSTLEMVIKLPASWPLRPAEVECRRRVGVAEGRLRKWLLSIAAFMRNQNGTLADAMALWRENCVREFSGVEECLICYSVVATSDGQLPRLKCQTCSKRFHKACLYKWFRSSGKSVCPHCQSPW